MVCVTFPFLQFCSSSLQLLQTGLKSKRWMTQILTGEDKTLITVLLVVYHVLANCSNGRRLTREDEEDDLNEALPLPCVCSCRQYERAGGYRIPVWWRESLGVYRVPNSWWKDQNNVNAVCLFNYKRKERQKLKKRVVCVRRNGWNLCVCVCAWEKRLVGFFKRLTSYNHDLIDLLSLF